MSSAGDRSMVMEGEGRWREMVKENSWEGDEVEEEEGGGEVLVDEFCFNFSSLFLPS